MTEGSSIFEDLKRMRDEIRLQIHLASMDARDEWNELETKWEKFAEKAQLKETAENLGEAAEELGGEIKAGYVKLKKALVDKISLSSTIETRHRKYSVWSVFVFAEGVCDWG